MPQSAPLLNIAHLLPLKFTSSNYLLWQTQILPLLHEYRLAHHIDGNQSPLPKLIDGTKVNPTYTSWLSQIQLLLSWIISFLSEIFLPQIVGVSTIREAQQTFAQTYVSSLRTHVRQLKARLNNLHQDNDPIPKYMQQAKTFFNQLHAFNHLIDKVDFVDVILLGLGPMYRLFIHRIESHFIMSFDDLYCLLLSEET